MARNSQVNFYLKPVDADGKALIFLNFKYSGNRLFFSFGERIKPKSWDEKRKRAKGSILTENKEHHLNELLDNLKEVCELAYKKEKAQGIPTPDTLKKYLQAFLNKNAIIDSPSSTPTLYQLIGRFINGEIQFRGKDKVPATIKTYGTTLNHLKGFEKAERYPVNFETINLDFYYRFTTYLKKEKLNPNSIGKQIKNVKTFMNEAVDLEYTDNLKFKHKKFVNPSQETDAVYLTDKEIIALYNFDFSGSKKLEQVRDLFVAGAFLGLRFSDYSNIRPENIIKNDNELYIKMKTQKTKELVIIPCNPVVLKIFDKYSENVNRLPKSISVQKFNDYLKLICKKAGLKEQGRLSYNLKLELWECVSSHTARRSFATNLYLEGFPTVDIMRVTGHKTETAFLHYIKVTKLDTAVRLQQHMKKNWSMKLLSIAS